MKTRLSLFCTAMTMLLSVNIANAQQLGQPGIGLGGQQPAFRAVSGDLLQPGLPGRLWFETNFADQGLGFDGSYVTLGGKSRLFQDALDGRWLLEGQLNHSIEDDGGFFANIGIERVFSIPSAKADLSIGAFYDYDDDDQQSFTDGFHQLGISGAIKTRNFDLIGNGYFPVGTEAFTLGDITGANPFLGNNIVLRAGIESALQGFDVTLRTRPKQLAFVNGYVDFGGYHYDSDLVDNFAGGRLRVGMQLINNLSVAAEVNHDERFDTTGSLSLALTFGAHNSGYGNEYAGLARDLEQYARNDHIVRFSQDLIVAINPLTGQAFNVIHANNTQLEIGDGTAESPFATLAEAEMASAVNDIILVDGGDGTDTGYQDGIALQDGQQLLSGGGSQFIQIADGSLFLVNQPGDTAATISNSGGNEVVLLADNNVIGGINIDATGAQFGVFGDGISDGVINESTISGAALDGVRLENVAGNFNFNTNTISGNVRNGVAVNGSVDPTSVFNFTNNVIDSNLVDGIQFTDFNADSIILTDNQTNNNGRNGVAITNSLNADATNILLENHIGSGNAGSGVLLSEGAGNVLITGGTFDNNTVAGLTTANWQTGTDQAILIAAAADGTQASFSNNTFGIDIDLLGTDLSQAVSITGATIDNNILGITADADGVGTELTLNIGGTTSFTGNSNQAVAQTAANGGTINSLIESTDAANPLAITGNGNFQNSSISYTLSGNDPNNRSEINAVVRNVNVIGAGGDALAVNGTGESRINLLVQNSLLQGPANGAQINFNNASGGEVNRTFFDNVDIRGNTGISATSTGGTLFDLSVVSSQIRSSGIISDNSAPFDLLNPAAFGPFTDANGINGILLNLSGNDSFTRLNLVDSTLEDFTFDGISILTSGNARLLANVLSNDILRNGPGQNNDNDPFPDPDPNDDIDPDDDGIAGIPSLPVDPTEGFFFDGIDIVSFGNSSVSLVLDNNTFLNNFERSVDLTAAGNSSITAVATENLFSSDIGFDTSVNPLPGLTGQIGLQNVSFDPFNPLNFGSIELALSRNTLINSLIDINGSLSGGLTTAGDITIGLDGLSNGFVPANLTGPFTTTTFGLTQALIDNEILFFDNLDFPPVSP